MAETSSTSDRITSRERYQKTASALWTERSSFDAHWREIAQYLFPVRPRFTLTDRNRGDRRTQSIIDSTATFASHTLRSGLHSGLTSPARPWMKLSTPDPSLAKFGPVKQWLFDVTERMHAVFQLSNLYNALPLLYGDMGVFGTAAMAVLDDPGAPGKPGDLFRCFSYPIGSYAMGMDNRGLVTTFVRHYVKTVAQLVEEFGGEGGRPLEGASRDIDWSRFSMAVKNLYEDGKYEATVNVTWIVQPNRGYDTHRLGAAGFPWSSCHFEKDGDTATVLRESGFHEFPILAPRWFANAEDTYGTDCPGMTALGDIKQLQMMQKRKGQAIEKMVNPPLVAPSSLRNQKVSMLPSDITYVDEAQGRTLVRPMHEVKPDLSHFVLDIQEVQYRINQAFYVDLFRMLSLGSPSQGSQPVTAREIDERHEEKLTALGPVLESTIDELLDPLIDRVFGMMSRIPGMIPPPPPDLHGVELTVEYVSMLAQAQKMAQLGLLDRFVQSSLAVGQVLPEAALVLKPREYVRAYGDGLGIAPSLMRTDDEIDALQQQQAQAQQSAAQAEELAKTATAAKALGDTKLDQGDTALTRVLASAGA